MGAYGNTPAAAIGVSIERQAPIKENSVDIIVNPNPFNINTSIYFPGFRKIASIYIYDLRGRLVQSYLNLQSRPLKWDASHLSNGIYVIKANIDGEIYSKKLLLQY